MAATRLGSLYRTCLYPPRVSTHALQAKRILCSKSHESRVNQAGIQLLSQKLHDQIFFGESCANSDSGEVNEKVRNHLIKYNLYNKSGPDQHQAPVEFDLPPLQGNNIDEHFYWIAKHLSDEYYNHAQQMASCHLPEMPKEWKYEEGWTRYEVVDNEMVVTPVNYPHEDCLVFDVEVCVHEGSRPTMAVAASLDAWYLWVSKQLVDNQLYTRFAKAHLKDNIPLESTDSSDLNNHSWNKKLIIGHHVGYDRSLIKEQYLLKGPKTYFLDTLSLHMCVSGLTRLQRGLLTQYLAGRGRKERWMDFSCTNSLVELHNMYSGSLQGGSKMDKEPRKVFVEGSLDDIRNDFQMLAHYNAQDVKATHEVFCALWPLFIERFPHPVSFAGMLEMSTTYLPIDQSWNKYLNDSDETYEDILEEMKKSLMRLANDTCQMYYGKRYLKDPWTWALNWSVQNIKLKKIKTKSMKESTRKEQPELKEEKVEESGEKITSASDEDWDFDEDENEFGNALALIPEIDTVLHKKRSHLCGYPLWYRKLCERLQSDEWKPGPSLISPQNQLTPYLLRMTWDGFPLHYVRVHGWGYLVPGRTDNLITPNEMYYDEMFDEESSTETSSAKTMAKQRRIFPTEVFSDFWKSRISEKDEQRTEAKDQEELSDLFELGDTQMWTDAEQEDFKMSYKLKTKKTKAASSKKESQNSVCYHKGIGPCNDVNLPGAWFFRIPHKDGNQFNVGSPLSKSYINKMECGTLKSEGEESARHTLKMNQMISFWRNAKKRISEQVHVWLNKEEFPPAVTSSEDFKPSVDYGAILPRMITAGTVTRRAVEPTWMTASNPRADSVGSELKSLVRAPPGYSFVGADVDSQELWIASILGDTHFAGMHGCTAFGWMTLQGKRSNNTDLHSRTAETLGISRNEAKVFNYARVYGAGQKFAEKLLLQFNHRLSETDAKDKAENLYKLTKGTQMYQLTDYGKQLAEEFEYSGFVIDDDMMEVKYYQMMMKTVRKFKRSRKPAFNGTRKWHGGSEAEVFNKLESIALSEEPKTPVLGCRVSRVLEPDVIGNGFLPSRVNWVVQSSAVDYLHLMLVSMKWLFEEYDIDGRFCISIHDEVRYLVNSKDRYRAALALQITNLLTRSLFSYKLGMRDLPQSVAFFSSVDIDKVLRKEVDLDCQTPSNPHGLDKGHGIKPGDGLDIYQILELTGGSLSAPLSEVKKEEVL